MKVTRRSTLSEVAACVATALAEGGIRCVLTGGACASLYTRGVYQSSDLDFVIQSAATRSQLDAAMRKIGFERHGDQYTHPATQFFVEFPPGPLAIGGDFRSSQSSTPSGEEPFSRCPRRTHAATDSLRSTSGMIGRA